MMPGLTLGAGFCPASPWILPRLTLGFAPPHPGRRVDDELELGFLAVLHREPLHQQRREATSGSATERVEDEEALETVAHVGQFLDAVQHRVNQLLTCDEMSGVLFSMSVALATTYMYMYFVIVQQIRINYTAVTS